MSTDPRTSKPRSLLWLMLPLATIAFMLGNMARDLNRIADALEDHPCIVDSTELHADPPSGYILPEG